MTASLNKKWYSRFIGDRAFYKGVLAIALPIMAQNALASLVNLLDNIMVGSVGTEAMSGVAIANRFIFIFNLLIFGVMASGGIFTAQYHGAKNEEGVRSTFRLKLALGLFFSAIAITVFIIFDDALISTFLHDGETGDISLTETLASAKTYLHIYLLGIIPYTVDQAYATTSRETGNAVLPMCSSFISIGVNFVLNAILIFGLLGFPAMGVAGAAVATVISRFAALGFNVIMMHRRKSGLYFTHGLYRSFKIPAKLLLSVAVKGLPIIFNECLWSMAVTMQNQAFSVRGIEVVAAFNIADVLINLLSVVYLAFNSSIAIVVGAQLGAGESERAKDTAMKMMVLSLFSTVVLGIIMISASSFFPYLYETTDAVRSLSTSLIIIAACFLPIASLAHSMYFILRTGGAVFSTALMDSGFMWIIAVPVAMLLVHLTPFNIITVYILSRASEILKVAFGTVLLKRGTWSKSLVGTDEQQKAPEAATE
ncbi:MAG: MATE family efflux transporter [Clostridia bacterium]|nr:MATE family efflux transporter [Clostridia bacterium]